MNNKKKFFKYCKYCGNKFIPSGREVRNCDKCNQKVRLLINLDLKLKRLKNSLPEYNLLEKTHKENIKKVIKELDKEVKLLKLELKK